MNRNVFLFEFGSTSLKLHFRLEGDLQAHEMKTPWRVGHEIFQSGRISGGSLAEAVSTVELLLGWMGKPLEREKIIAVATGAFRQGENTADFFGVIRERTGLRVRLISGNEEASLLAHQFRRTFNRGSGFAFDLGGGSLQWVLVEIAEPMRYGSIPVGAIRLLKEAMDSRGNFQPCAAVRLAEMELSSLPEVQVDRLVGTGGTVKAVRKVLGRPRIGLEAIEALQTSAWKDGPPHTLMPHRRPIFLPGVILIVQLMKAVGARELCHASLSVGKALLEMLLPEHEESPARFSASEILEHSPVPRGPEA